MGSGFSPPLRVRSILTVYKQRPVQRLNRLLKGIPQKEIPARSCGAKRVTPELRLPRGVREREYRDAEAGFTRKARQTMRSS
jgi:hypothetical protein